MMKRRDCRDLALSGNDLFIDATYLLLLLALVLAGQEGHGRQPLNLPYWNHFSISIILEYFYDSVIHLHYPPWPPCKAVLGLRAR